MVVLKEAKGIKYGQFVEPGQTLRVTAEVLSQTDRETVVKARGVVDGRVTVNGRLVLERYDLAETQPQYAVSDKIIKDQMRSLFALLYQPNGRAGKPIPEGE
jgi:3-hydroxyacyl-[acyl-carrier-protein] dehydratase